MRTRIALIAAITVACITSFMTLFNGLPVANAATGTSSPHGAAGHSLVAFIRPSKGAIGWKLPLSSGARHRTHEVRSRFPTATLTSQLRVHTAFSAAALTVIAPPPPPPPPPTDATSTDTTDWQCIRIRESGDEYNNPAEPSGAYGILEVTWLSNGYSGWPYEASATAQNALALKLYNEFGWDPWSSRFACGL